MKFQLSLFALCAVGVLSHPSAHRSRGLGHVHKRCAYADFLKTHQEWSNVCQSDPVNCPPEPQPCYGGGDDAPSAPAQSGGQAPKAAAASNEKYSGCTKDCEGIATYQHAHEGSGCFPDQPEYSDGASNYLIALPMTLMNSPAHRPDWEFASNLCNTIVTVSANGKSIPCQVADMCPGCKGANGVDLSEAAIVELYGSLDAGNWDVTWTLGK